MVGCSTIRNIETPDIELCVIGDKCQCMSGGKVSIKDCTNYLAVSPDDFQKILEHYGDLRKEFVDVP